MNPMLVAWIGEDEHGSGEVGLKQGFTPVGLVPLVAIHAHLGKMTHLQLIAQLQAQADGSGKTIRLALYEYLEDLIVITPKGGERL